MTKQIDVHYAFDTKLWNIEAVRFFAVSNRQCLIVFLSTEKKSLAGDKNGGNFMIGRIHLYLLLVDL